MPMDEQLVVRGFQLPSMCSLCCDNIETTSHIFFQCKYVTNIWNWLLQKMNFTGSITCLQGCLKMIKSFWSPQVKDVALSCICSVYHQVWRARNLNRFNDKTLHWKSSISNIISRAKLVKNTT